MVNKFVVNQIGLWDSYRKRTYAYGRQVGYRPTCSSYRLSIIYYQTCLTTRNLVKLSQRIDVSKIILGLRLPLNIHICVYTCVSMCVCMCLCSCVYRTLGYNGSAFGQLLTAVIALVFTVGTVHDVVANFAVVDAFSIAASVLSGAAF